MLVLKRKPDEGVVIWNEQSPSQQLKVSFRKLPDGTYQMQFEGPRCFKIFREEMVNSDSFEDKK
jgi:sRNA-binding carbon storage regulator CsrA